jgi:integrase
LSRDHTPDYQAAKLDKKNNITTKLIVWKQAGKKGYPLKVRITKNRRSTYINLKHYLSKSEINKFISQKNEELLPSYPKYDEVMSEYNRAIAQINPKSPDPVIISDLTFSEYLDKDINKLEDRGKWGYAQKTKSVRYHLKKFTNDANIKFEEIDIDFLNDLQTYFIQNNIAGITQKGYFDKIKTLLNNAKKEDKYLPIKDPFLAFVPEPFEIVRKNLERFEFELIDAIKINNQKGHRSKHIPENIFETTQKFKFQYYGLGMRVSDMILLKWGDIKEDGTRIEFKMFKTKRTINFPITNELHLILFSKLPDFYQDHVFFLFDADLRVEHQKLFKLQSQELMNDLVLEKIAEHSNSVLSDISIDEDYANKYILEMIPNGLEGRKLYSKIQQATRQYNADLKDLQNHFGIRTKITTHTPRHTFAINAIIDKKLDIYQLSKALNHSSVKVTESYLRGFKSTEIDESLKNFYNSKNESVSEIVEKRVRMKSFPGLEDMSDEYKKELLQQLQQGLHK